MGACLAVEGVTTRIVFEAYVEKVLVPSLRHGQVVVMDNLSAHKGERVRELVESAGCELLYLPPYSPDFSPIEEAFSKIKGLMRKTGARSRKALWWRLWVRRSMQSPPEMRDVSLSIVDTALWVNCFDQCCRVDENDARSTPEDPKVLIALNTGYPMAPIRWTGSSVRPTATPSLIRLGLPSMPPLPGPKKAAESRYGKSSSPPNRQRQAWIGGFSGP